MEGEEKKRGSRRRRWKSRWRVGRSRGEVEEKSGRRGEEEEGEEETLERTLLLISLPASPSSIFRPPVHRLGAYF